MADKEDRTDKEDRILALRGEIAVLQQEIKRLGASLSLDCTHRYKQHWHWTSDNGYGNLVSRTGWQCESCGKVDPWGSGNWGSLED